MPTRVIFDTDIGTDVDDAVALALILGSPELQLEGVTCVYGNVLLRARMALKLLKLRGRLDVPVMAGMSRTILNLRPIYWAGHEGEGLLDAEDENVQPLPEFAVDYIIRIVMENPGQIHLICVGPLTNAAMAFLREPKLAQNLAGLTIMGGVQRGANGLYLPYTEHNIVCDPEAAHIVMSSGAPITLVPLDVTTRVHITQEGAAKIRTGGTPYHDAVATQVEVYPPLKARGWTHMHDPLAVAAVIQPDMLSYELLHVDVEMGGRLSTAATLMRTPSDQHPENARVALGVNVERFETFLIDRLSK